ncbi:MAG: glycosyltransferase [Actinomycetota bacterium]|nr:glycosyltransferase [Actinomycetota bacterium]
MKRDRRIALVSNASISSPDEGIRKLGFELSRRLPDDNLIVEIAQDAPALTRKLMLGRSLKDKLRGSEPSAVIYLPTQSASLGSHIRSAILRWVSGAPVLMIATQPGHGFIAERAIARAIGPKLIATPSPPLLQRLGPRRARFVAMGVDLETFRPPTAQEREQARDALAVGDKPVVLHVGHLTRARNFDALISLHNRMDVSTLVVTDPHRSSNEILESLRRAGISVVNHFLPEIRLAYWAADCYVFQVENENGAIGVPLSVLEAMATDLPVVTTPFGGLPKMFKPTVGFRFASNDDERVSQAQNVLNLPRDEVGTRQMVMGFSWDHVTRELVQAVTSLCG